MSVCHSRVGRTYSVQHTAYSMLLYTACRYMIDGHDIVNTEQCLKNNLMFQREVSSAQKALTAPSLLTLFLLRAARKKETFTVQDTSLQYTLSFLFSSQGISVDSLQWRSLSDDVCAADNVELEMMQVEKRNL